MLFLHNLRDLKKFTTVVLGVISALSFVSFLFPTISVPLYTLGGNAPPSQVSFYSPIDRIWQFTLGGLAFLSQERFQKWINKIPKGIHFLTVITVVMILFGPVHVNLKVSSIIASFFAVIIILLRSLDVLPNYLIQKLTWVGDRSYSIYLVHMPLLFLAKYSPATQFGSIENRRIQSTIAVIASILLGALSYSKIEKNIGIKAKLITQNLKQLQLP
jgi:peptidoglycan/LPS O-acetylase OafA/YrhL